MYLKCSSCKMEKTKENFSIQKGYARGFSYICKQCSGAYFHSWRINNPGRARDAELRRTYGITLEEYNTIKRGQLGVCAICGKPPGNTALFVDHNHTTGKIRGLLCRSCNTAIGMFRDDIGILQKAIEYLDRNEIRITKEGEAING